MCKRVLMIMLKMMEMFLNEMENHVSHDVTHLLDIDILEARWNTSCHILLMIRVMCGMD